MAERAAARWRGPGHTMVSRSPRTSRTRLRRRPPVRWPRHASSTGTNQQNATGAFSSIESRARGEMTGQVIDIDVVKQHRASPDREPRLFVAARRLCELKLTVVPTSSSTMCRLLQHRSQRTRSETDRAGSASHDSWRILPAELGAPDRWILVVVPLPLALLRNLRTTTSRSSRLIRVGKEKGRGYYGGKGPGRRSIDVAMHELTPQIVNVLSCQKATVAPAFVDS
jgi:hypothetical protein